MKEGLEILTISPFLVIFYVFRLSFRGIMQVSKPKFCLVGKNVS